MGYREDVRRLIDMDGLIGQGGPGSVLTNSYWTGGNQILDSMTDILIRKKLNILTEYDLFRVQTAIHNCELKKGLYDKNPAVYGQRRMDLLAFDDYVGLCCVSFIVGSLPFNFDIYNYGIQNRWIFNNTGSKIPPFTSISKPWHIIVYRICAGDTDFSSLERFLFFCWLGSSPKMKDNSGVKLRWHVCEAIRRAPKTSTLHPDFKVNVEQYMRKLNEQGGIHTIMKGYYGEWHPFANYSTFI